MILQTRSLRKEFGSRGFLQRRQPFVAVDGVDLQVAEGETLALVGESGSGKTTVGMMVLGLLQPTSGEVLFEGRKLEGLTRSERQKVRRRIQVVFQDPYASLNARMTVGEAVTEGMVIHGLGESAADRAERATKLLEQVGLSRSALDRYPHEFSGGQRQRIAIARALSVEPKFLVLDEPTSALDVSVQSQVLNLLRRLQAELGLSYLFITHNLGVVEYMAHRACVMERGKVVEEGPVEQIFDAPAHPYTQKLLNSIPSGDPAASRIRALG